MTDDPRDDEHVEDLDATDEEAGEVKGGFSWGVANTGAAAHKNELKINKIQAKFGDGSVKPGGF